LPGNSLTVYLHIVVEEKKEQKRRERTKEKRKENEEKKKKRFLANVPLNISIAYSTLEMSD
jgi:phosphate/sulfate permease